MELICKCGRPGVLRIWGFFRDQVVCDVCQKYINQAKHKQKLKLRRKQGLCIKMRCNKLADKVNGNDRCPECHADYVITKGNANKKSKIKNKAKLTESLRQIRLISPKKECYTQSDIQNMAPEKMVRTINQKGFSLAL